MSRALMLEHYEQHLRVSTSRNGRPYAPETIRGYMRYARLNTTRRYALSTHADLDDAVGYLPPMS